MDPFFGPVLNITKKVIFSKILLQNADYFVDLCACLFCTKNIGHALPVRLDTFDDYV